MLSSFSRMWPFLRGGETPSKPAVVPNLDDVEEIAMGLTSGRARKRGWGINMAVQSDTPKEIGR